MAAVNPGPAAEPSTIGEVIPLALALIDHTVGEVCTMRVGRGHPERQVRIRKIQKV